MPKGRHRRPQQNQTTLPAGARVLTGKSRTAAKQATYSLPLPIKLDLVHDGRQSQKRKVSQNSQSWRQFLASLVGWGASSDRRSGQQAQRAQARPDTVTGQWDPLTRSVHVQVTRPIDQKGKKERNDDNDDEDGAEQTEGMRMLWECGFFGKGTLSRSEPTWRSRQVNTLRIKRQQARGQSIFTPEELTALRRKERKAAKIERARLAVRAGQQLADGIVALGGELTEEDERAIANDVQRELDASKRDENTESAYGKHIPGLIYLKPKQDESQDKADTGGNILNPTKLSKTGVDQFDAEGDEEYIDIEDMETLQLSSYETLFLAGMLGCLKVVDETGNEIELAHLYALLLSANLSKAAPGLSPLEIPSMEKLAVTQSHWSRPDNPFLINYVAYHHFRSLGWVVRSGIKFCVDLLLYKKGPAFSHAEFAVVVVPVYEDPNDEASSPFSSQDTSERGRDWVWFSSVNRVNTQVLKTVVLCYVVIPPMSRITSNDLSSPRAFVDSLKSGQSFYVREYAVRRFTPQRMRA